MAHISELTVKVNLVDSVAPSITSTNTFTLDEGVTSVATLQASDTSNVVWTIDGGANQLTLLFQQVANLQFRRLKPIARPLVDDADGNAPGDRLYRYILTTARMYEVIVVATDEGGLASTPQTITVTLEDALAPAINAVAGAVKQQRQEERSNTEEMRKEIAVYGFRRVMKHVYWR